MNIYNFTGHLPRDAEVRTTQNGSTMCSFSVAVNYGYGDYKGTNWIRCTIFGKRAEGGLPQYLLKGTHVAVTGELKIGEYTDRDGNKRTSVDVTVASIDLVGGKAEGGAPSQAPAAAPTAGDTPAVPVDDHIPF